MHTHTVIGVRAMSLLIDLLPDDSKQIDEDDIDVVSLIEVQ